MPSNNHYPKLRPVDVRPFSQSGQASLLLRDPLQLSDHYLIVPEFLAPAVALCDGTRDIANLRATLAVRYGLALSTELLQQLVTALDQALLLENNRAAKARESILADYRQAPFRTPFLAGQSYPADPAGLRHLLDTYLAEVSPPAGVDGIRGLISPHIDYRRGGHVYASVWKEAEAAVRWADLVILVGTDHYDEGDRLTLTRQHFATPYGVLPAALGIVDRLAEAIGPQAAFAGEIRHRSEHALELVAVWLHHMRGGEPCEILPILCGSLSDLIPGQGDPAQDPAFDALVETLGAETSGRRALVVASGDLAHVGPAFGGLPVNDRRRAQVQADDQEFLGQLANADAAGFFDTVKCQGDRNNVCGITPFYLTKRLLDRVEGRVVSYDHCPADQHGTSLVSVCGMVFG